MEKGGKMISKKVNSVQEWLPVDEILENGIIKVKNKNYINEDIASIDKEDIPDHNLLVGGFPCQDY